VRSRQKKQQKRIHKTIAKLFNFIFTNFDNDKYVKQSLERKNPLKDSEFIG